MRCDDIQILKGQSEAPVDHQLPPFATGTKRVHPPRQNCKKKWVLNSQYISKIKEKL